ncbi:MAG TPA: hypothetical protein VEI02_16845 [Planctomycetota bacterium]|nr:hypothetical protein [Planctomycetota bacterium]
MTIRPLLAACLLVATAAAQEAVFKNGWHEDRKMGFKIRVPEKWDQVPMSPEERWIVAKYLCNREYVARGEFYFTHKPTLRVIVFLDDAKKVKGPKIDTEETEEGTKITGITLASVPYKDYQDYLKRNSSEGFHVEKEVEGKGAGGVVCKKYDVRIDKLAAAKRRIVTWVFRNEAGEYAVEFDALEEHFDKLYPTFEQALKSFTFIKADAAITAGSSTGESSPGSSFSPTERKKWREMSADERRKRRKDAEEARLNAVKKKIPEGWRISQSKNFHVLSHTDERFTEKVVEAAEACRKWMDETFGAVSDEYVMRGVIRVFASYDEYFAYAKGSSDTFSPLQQELLTFKDANMGARTGFDLLLTSVGRRYLYDKDPVSYLATPAWFDAGFSGVLGSAVVKDGKLQLQTDAMEARAIAANAGKAAPSAKDLLSKANDAFYSDGYMTNAAYSARLFRWLAGPGQKVPHLKGFLAGYVKTAIELENAEPEKPEDGKERPKSVTEAESEEEEERLLKERKESRKKEGSESMKALFDKATGAWTDAQWKTLENGFESTIK